MNAFQKADRLVGSNELSRGANAIINTARAEKDASFAAGCLKAKHGIEGGLTEEEAIELNVLLAILARRRFRSTRTPGPGRSRTSPAAQRRARPAGHWSFGRTSALTPTSPHRSAPSSTLPSAGTSSRCL
jgi:hypothetical protein